MSEAKPFCISKKEVWEAFQRVKENKGAAGVDEQSLSRQEWSQNWNRCFMQTPSDIDQGSQHWMLWDKREKDVGAMNGLLTWTLKASWIHLHNAPLFMK